MYVRILSILTSFKYIKVLILLIDLKFALVLTLMGINGNGKRNGYMYNEKSLKRNIENNQYVKIVRKKLMEAKLKKKFHK